jgi:effector-binding domain-containing protein
MIIMNRKAWIPFLILLIAGIAVFFALQPKIEKYGVEGRYQALKAVEHLADPVKVAKWMLPFSSAKPGELQFTPQSVIYGTDTVEITQQSAIDVKYLKKKGSSSMPFIVSAEPPVDRPRNTIFKMTYATTRWNSWKGGSALEKEAKQSLDKLKKYFEDPVELYGYDIKRITVTDTTFLFASRTIDSDKFAEESKALYEFLIGEAKKRDVVYTGVRIFHFEDDGNNIRKIFAGISINRSLKTKNDDPVNFKMMPYGKYLLAVDYEGPYYNIKKVNEAIEAYRTDNQLVSMAIPFHKYLSDGYGFTDSQVVKLRVCYPVY